MVGINTKQWIIGIIANITIFTYGMQSGWMSPNILILKSNESPSGYPMSDFEISIIASAFSFSAAIASAFYSIISDKFGRKIGLIAVAIPQAMSWLIKLASANFYALVISQCFSGIAGGGVFCVAPIYTKEISKDKTRGAMGSIGMLLSSVGLLVMYVMGGYLDYYTVLWVVSWIPILNILCLLKTPESPAYLVKTGKIEKAAEALSCLCGVSKTDTKVTIALATLKKEQEQADNLPSVTVTNILSNKASRKAIIVALLLICVLDIGGNFAIFTYASVIVEQSGVTSNPNVQAIIFPIVMIIGSLLSAVVVEKFGRKPLLLTSIFSTALAMAVLATYLLLKQNGTMLSVWMPFVSIAVCIFAYGAGILPVPYIVMAEIFSYKIRTKVMGFIVTLGWFLAFVQVITFTPISKFLGMYTMFYIFCGVNIVGGIATIIILPETKGKSLEEIEAKFMGKQQSDLQIK